MMRTFFGLVLLLLVISVSPAQDDSRQQADAALRKAVGFYTNDVSSHGGYLYRYSADLKKREGEGKADADTVWVQPPGTPAVGMAFLEAYELTGDEYLLDAAKAAGECLIQGQLTSGGWDSSIDLSPAGRRRFAFRSNPKGQGKTNVTTFDDDKTQSAMRLLIRLDETLKFKDERVHEAAMYALDAALKAQYPNGAWPQRYSEFPDPEKFPIKKASYPDSWPREFPGRDYKTFYTFNDNAIADVVDVMFLAARVYQDDRFREAAMRAGGFILLAQLPDPQPAWAQQYDLDMHPAWARKFEPPSITGGESQGVIRTLLSIYRQSGERKYLEPIPRAIAYLKSSRLDEGRLARFYELKTNRPLYFTKEYVLTYDDGDVPTHYAFKVSDKLDSLAAEYERTSALDAGELARLREKTPGRPRPSSSLQRQAEAVAAALDERGAWVEEGRLKYHGDDDPTRQVIDSQTFIQNVGILSRYLAATEKESE